MARRLAVVVAALIVTGVATQARAEEPTPSPPAPAVEGSAPPSLASDERPGSGLGLIITGWVMTGIGALNFATLPICSADFYPKDSKDLCIKLSIGIGVIGLGVGIPALIVGYNKKRRSPIGSADTQPPLSCSTLA